MFNFLSNQKAALREAHLKAWLNRRNTRQRSNRALPLCERGMPKRKLQQLTTVEDRITTIHDVVNWLNVEHSLRYRRSGTTTYCNIYVHDLAYCLGAYLPRVWWHEDVIPDLLLGRSIKAKYGVNVFEQNSNALANWFEQYGSYYNWVKAESADELQNVVNRGWLGIIVSQRVQWQDPGHITSVVPETGQWQAVRSNGRVEIPLQTQAGEENKKYSTDQWWNNAKFKKTGFWYYAV